MVNQLVIAGILKEKPILKKTEKGIHYCNLILDVKREYKNIEGNYDVDEICFTLWRSIAENCITIVNVGDVVAVKGRVQSSVYIKEDGNKYYNYEFIAEKVFALEGNK